MELSAFAYILAVSEFLVGVPMVVSPKQTSAWLLRLIKDDMLIRIVALLYLVISVLVLVEHPMIGFTVSGLVSLLAWFGAIKCVVLCWWATQPARFGEKIMAIVPLRAAGALAIGFGVLLAMAGWHLTV